MKKKVIIILLSIFSFIAFFTMMYPDILESSTRSYFLLDSLFDLNFPYGYNFESAFYIPVHIVFAIWNLPAWILYRFGIGNPQATVNLLWAKLLIVLCLIGIIYIFNKLLDECDFKGNKLFWSLLLFTSLLIFPVIFDMSQYDCIGLLVGLYGTLLAIRCEDNKISINSLILLSIASSIKLLFLFAGICIILVKNKKISKVITNLLVLLSSICIFFILSECLTIIKDNSLLIASTASVETYNDLSNGMFQRLFTSSFPGSISQVSFYFLFSFILYFALYFCNFSKTKKEQLYMIAFGCAVSYLIMFSFTLTHPQWSIYPAFFVILLLALSDDAYTYRNMICLEIFEISLFLQQIIYYDWVYLCESEFDLLLLKNFNNNFFSKNLINLRQFLSDGIADIAISAISALMIADILFIILNNNPWKRIKTNDNNIDIKRVNDTILNIRVIIVVVYVISGLLIRLVL